jgi:predicted dehydrogenase
MVGFNRRFAPHVVKAKELLAAAPGPKAFVMTVNAGAIPASTGRRTPSGAAAASWARGATSWTCSATWPARPSRGGT